MEKAFPILMLCFAGLLLVYAGILALTKDVMLIPHADKAKIPDPKAYALRFAGIMALVTIGPLASGIAGLIYDNKRAAIALIRGGQACALLDERDFVLPEDVQHMFLPVLGHRMILSPESKMKGTQAEQVLLKILQNTPVPVKL